MSHPLWFEALVGVPLGLLTANAVEWVMHKYVLHGLGKRKGSFWNFHWYEHHSESRKNDMLDSAYTVSWFAPRVEGRDPGWWNPRTKEIVSLTGGALLNVPLIVTGDAPGFAVGSILSAVLYYTVHRKSHVDPAWGRRWLPWHVDHHMAPNQDANWCVTFPLFDWILRTREKYVGGDRERADREKRETRSAARASWPSGALPQTPPSPSLRAR